MKFVGIDYSMTCPCMCLLGESKTFFDSEFYFLSDRKKDVNSVVNNIYCQEHALHKSEMERFDKISNFFIEILRKKGFLEPGQCKVFLEDYSMGSKGKVFHIAENTAILKYKLYKYNVELVTVPPTVVKKFASGKGNSDKDVMYKAFLDQGYPDITKFYYDKVKVKITSPMSDIVDSYFIAKYGEQWIQQN